MNLDCLQADQNLFICFHTCCPIPISVLRDYQNNLNVSYYNGPVTQDISKYTMCINRPALCIGIHMLPNRRKTSTQIPCKDNQLSRVSSILTSFVYHAMQDVSSKMISAAPVRGMLAPYPSHFPWRGQLVNQPQNLSRITGRWQSD